MKSVPVTIDWGDIVDENDSAEMQAIAVRALFEARHRRSKDVRDVGPWQNAVLECDGRDIARAYELRSGNHDRRKSTGAFYTPHSVARELIEFRWSGAPQRVLDPACGCGAFLIAAAEALAERGLDALDIGTRLHGVDIDPIAVSICRGRLTELLGAGDFDRRIIVADSLAPTSGPDGTFDLIAGNPPFGNAIEARTARSDAERTDYAERFPQAATGAYDRAGLFVEASLRRLDPGGRLAMVLPRALLSARYASQLRRFIEREFSLTGVRAYTSAAHFEDAAVYVVGVVVEQTVDCRRRVTVRDGDGERTTELRSDDSWAPLISSYASVLERIPAEWPRLGDHALIQASATAGEAYEIRDHVTESWPNDGWKLLTTGSIDPFTTLWATATTRYLKSSYVRPWIPRAAVSARRAELYDAPKVLVAGLSKVLEAVADPAGELAGAVATIAVRPRQQSTEALHALEIFLNSWLARTQFLALNGAQALGGGSVQVTKRKLADLRFPPGLLTASLQRPTNGPKSLPELDPRAATTRAWDREILRLAGVPEWIDSSVDVR